MKIIFLILTLLILTDAQAMSCDETIGYLRRKNLFLELGSTHIRYITVNALMAMDAVDIQCFPENVFCEEDKKILADEIASLKNEIPKVETDQKLATEAVQDFYDFYSEDCISSETGKAIFASFRTIRPKLEENLTYSKKALAQMQKSLSRADSQSL